MNYTEESEVVAVRTAVRTYITSKGTTLRKMIPDVKEYNQIYQKVFRGKSVGHKDVEELVQKLDASVKLQKFGRMFAIQKQ